MRGKGGWWIRVTCGGFDVRFESRRVGGRAAGGGGFEVTSLLQVFLDQL